MPTSSGDTQSPVIDPEETRVIDPEETSPSAAERHDIETAGGIPPPGGLAPPPHRLTWPGRVRWLGNPLTFLWAGLLTTAAGFAVIAYAWAKVAGLLIVSLQLPYLVSGGLTGLGLMLIGLTTVNAAVKHRDAVEQDRKLSQLSATVHRLRVLLEADEPGALETGEPGDPGSEL